MLSWQLRSYKGQDQIECGLLGDLVQGIVLSKSEENLSINNKVMVTYSKNQAKYNNSVGHHSSKGLVQVWIISTHY